MQISNAADLDDDHTGLRLNKQITSAMNAENSPCTCSFLVLFSLIQHHLQAHIKYKKVGYCRYG